MGVMHQRTSIYLSKSVSAIVLMATFLGAFSLQGQSDSLQIQTDFHAVTILPFFMDLVEDEDAPPARRELRMREIALENMHGIQWAAERLSNAGYHIELGFFDEVADRFSVGPEQASHHEKAQGAGDDRGDDCATIFMATASLSTPCCYHFDHCCCNIRIALLAG